MTTRQIRCSRPARARGAFTLLEVLIAVGALGLIAVGLSQIFRATGETVKAGRRLSNLNTYAAMLESQFRRDFASMTRDGFLVIRNEEVRGLTGSNGAPLYDGQNRDNWRRRRVDELMFFATGDFVTQRPPVHPTRIARAPAARIYYGHGLRLHPQNVSIYAAPVNLEYIANGTGFDIPAAFGFPHSNTMKGANQFASDWILMRHVLLLSPPSQVEPPLVPTGGGLTPLNQPDHEFQIALQPAVRSVFRRFAEQGGTVPSQTNRSVRNAQLRPRLDCGVVDIATTDLTEIRAFLIAGGSDDPRWQPPQTADLRQPLLEIWPRTFPVGPANGVGAATAARMRGWMQNAFPTDSQQPVTAGGTPRGGRMRVEPKPPNPLAYAGSYNGGIVYSTANDLRREIQRADQMMLSTSVFAPGCTEFIVEWTFGKRYPIGDPQEGELIWHGMERGIDRDGDGTISNNEIIVGPYVNASPFEHEQQYFKKDGSVATHPVSQNLIHDATMFNNAVRSGYSFFGYTNPTYPLAAPGPNDPYTIPWPWPKLIRITMSLVDPADPRIEQTFQFILSTPGDPGDTRFQ